MSQNTMSEPTRVAASRPQAPVTNILVPVDFAAPAEHALAYARELAERFGASIQLLHVVSMPYVLPVTDAGLFTLTPEVVGGVVKDAEKRLAEALAGIGEPARSRTQVRTGDPRTEIIAVAAEEGADLIIMGTRGRTGASHLIFGSVAEHVVRTAPCPVLTVR